MKQMIFLLVIILQCGAEDIAPVPPVTVGELMTKSMACFDQKGKVDIAGLETMLKEVNAKVAASGVYQKSVLKDENANPLEGNVWTLWVFWAADVPESAGLAQSVTQVKGSQEAQVQTIHLAGLRHIEAYLFNCNDKREALYAAIKKKDEKGIKDAEKAWNDYMRTMVEMTREKEPFPVQAPTLQAKILKVDQVPCFRLISPAKIVHRLDGFSAEVDLVAWVQKCKKWEAEARKKGQIP